jgi:RNA polymerase sigma-70 factor, ECF subfamily
MTQVVVPFRPVAVGERTPEAPAPAIEPGPRSAAVLAAWERGQAAWPEVRLAPPTFAAFLDPRLQPGEDAVDALARLRAEDLYLACACLEGDPAALRAFEERYLARVPQCLASLRPSATVVDDTRQLLREKLLVGSGAGRAKLEQYAGQGPLEGWIRVAAVRTALNLLAATPPGHLALDEGRDGAGLTVAAGADVELDYLRARYRGHFAAAFKESVAALEPRQRTLLRFHYLDHLIPEKIGAIYGVHRTTAMRWIAATEAALLAGVKQRVEARLQLDSEDCDSLLALVRSRLDVTLTSLLGNTRAP